MGIAANKMFCDFTKDFMRKIITMLVGNCFMRGFEDSSMLFARRNPLHRPCYCHWLFPDAWRSEKSSEKYLKNIFDTPVDVLPVLLALLAK
jgi:hypothetical protein